MKFILRFFIALCISLSAIQMSASHIMGGNITYECVGNNTYAFTAEFYRDCNGVTLPNSITLQVYSNSCNLGQSFILELIPSGGQNITPICSSEPDVCVTGSGTYGVQRYVYTHVPASQGQGISDPPVTMHDTCSDWRVYWSSCCRNGAITTGPANDGFYIQTVINNTNNICNNSPTFAFDPILFGCVGDTIQYSHGVSDAENDSLIFSLTDCQELAGNNSAPVAYTAPYSGSNPLSSSGLFLDSLTGTLTFVPNIAQVAVICVLVEEYRNGIKIGEVTRDIQIGILNCANQSPTLSGINGVQGQNSLSVCAGQNVCFTIDVVDNNTAQTVAMHYSNTLSGATYNITSNGHQSQINICWTPSINDRGRNIFGLSVEDDACPIVGKGNYSYFIDVVGVGGGATFNEISISQGAFAQLQVNVLDPSCMVTWTPAATLSCTNCLNPVATPSTTTTYYYQINCLNGSCGTISDSIIVNVLSPKTLTGTITTSSGQPLANSIIHTLNAQYILQDSTITDSLGNYSLMVDDSLVYVFATPNSTYFDQLLTYYDSTTNYLTATPYLFSNGATSGTLNFSTLGLSKTVSGTITQSNAAPLDNSTIYLLDDNFNILDSTLTDNVGQYSFNTFENSVYLLAIPNNLQIAQLPTFYSGTIDTSDATIILFTSLQTTADFSTIQTPISITGTINRADGLPLDNSWVYLIDTSLMNVDSLLTTAQGYYSFEIIDTTIYYYLKAVPSSNHTDQVITYYNGSETVQAADSVAITTITNVTDFNTIDTFSLTGGKSIGGIVNAGTDFTPTPLAGIRLILKDINGNFINDAITDSDGKFKFYGLTNGTYKVLVDKDGVDNSLAPIIELKLNETSPENLDFLLHSYYLEMFYPTATTEAFKVETVNVYPNPIQNYFTINYSLLTSANVTIDLLDFQGKIVESLQKEYQTKGEYQLIEKFSKNTLPNGIYFVRLKFDNQLITKKIIVKGQ